MTVELARQAADRAAVDALPTRRSRREHAAAVASGAVPAVAAPVAAGPGPALETRASRRAQRELEAAARAVVEDAPASAPVVASEPTVVSAPVTPVVVDEPVAPAVASEPVTRRSVAARRTPRRPWVPRAAVVAALAVTTIALPTTGALSAIKGSPVTDLVGGATASTADAALHASGPALGPSTLAIVQQATQESTTPKILAQSVSSDVRRVEAASRSETRSALTDCVGGIVDGTNGNLDTSRLCTLPQGSFQLQPDAAIAFTEMSDAFEAHFGRPMRVASAYRSYSEQSVLRSTKPGLAAVPGTSNHGWGYAVDLTSSTYGSASEWAWLNENAASFGWINPDWAKGAKYEPWHWEYVAGVHRVGGTL